MRRIDISELTRNQLEVAREAITAMSSRISMTRIEAICTALARGDVLINYRNGRPIGASFDETDLTREELVEAAALELRLREHLGEDAAGHAISFLGQSDAALQIFLGSTVAAYAARQIRGPIPVVH